MNVTSEAGVLVIGDGFFADLRPLRHWSERVCFVASILSNAVLAVLLIREKNQTLKPYSRVLLINVGADVFYAVMSLLVEMVIDSLGTVSMCDFPFRSDLPTPFSCRFSVPFLPKTWRYR